MAYPLLQSTAAQKVVVRLFDSNDHVTPETGVTSPTLTISKNGGTLASPSDGTWAELGGGAYTIQLDATDTDTVGPLVVRVVKAGCDDGFALCHVRANTEKEIYDRVGAPAGADLAADVATVDANVDSILADTGTDGVAISTATVNTIRDAVFAKTGLTAGGSATFEAIVKAIYAMARGKISVSGNDITVYDDDDSTALFTLTISATGRTTA